MTVTPIAHCKNISCREAIHVKDVYREKDVNSAPGNIVVMFKCGHCGLAGRLVGDVDTWRERQSEAQAEENDHEGLIYGFHCDLQELVTTVADLENIWASYNKPPMIESDIKCACSTCVERRGYGTR